MELFAYCQPPGTSYRTTTGHRVDVFFGICFVCLTIPFAVPGAQQLPAVRPRGRAEERAAVRDFLDWSAEGYLVQIEVEASDPQHMRLLEGTFEAMSTTGANTLLVRDTTEGRVFSLGPAYTANFQPSPRTPRRRSGRSRRQIDLAGRVLADLESLVPAGAAARSAT